MNNFDGTANACQLPSYDMPIAFSILLIVSMLLVSTGAVSAVAVTNGAPFSIPSGGASGMIADCTASVSCSYADDYIVPYIITSGLCGGGNILPGGSPTALPTFSTTGCGYCGCGSNQGPSTSKFSCLYTSHTGSVSVALGGSAVNCWYGGASDKTGSTCTVNSIDCTLRAANPVDKPPVARLQTSYTPSYNRPAGSVYNTHGTQVVFNAPVYGQMLYVECYSDTLTSCKIVSDGSTNLDNTGYIGPCSWLRNDGTVGSSSSCNYNEFLYDRQYVGYKLTPSGEFSGTYGLVTNTNDLFYAGMHTVTLTATDSSGRTSTSSVTFKSPPSFAPTATLVASSTAYGLAPLTVSFVPTCSDSDGTITSCTIFFGDEASGQTWTSASSGSTVSHTYTVAGNYDARAKAVDNENLVAVSQPVTILVSAPQPAGPASVASEGSVCENSATWLKQFTVQEPGVRTGASTTIYAMSADRSGNVYVGGNAQFYSSAEWTRTAYLRKYSSAGDMIWTKFYGRGWHSDNTNGVATDSSGNVYATYWEGSTGGSTPVRYYSEHMMKFNSAGTLIFDNVYGANDQSYTGTGAAIATDSSGNYAVATAQQCTDYTTEVAFSCIGKYRGDGTGLWGSRTGIPFDLYKQQTRTVTYGLATDSSGNVYAVGFTDGTMAGQTSAGGTDAFLKKFNGANGASVWIRQFGTSAYEIARAVAVDSAGNIYVGGYTSGELQAGHPVKGTYDAFLTKFDLNGVRIWTRQFGTDLSDAVLGVAIDGSNNVYVTGYSNHTETGPNVYSSTSAVFVNKYASDGSPLWTYKYDAAGSEEVANGISIDSSNNVYLGGIQGWHSGLLIKLPSTCVKVNKVPTSTLSAKPTDGFAPLKVEFSTVCSDPDGTITSCKILFGDETAGQQAAELGATLAVNHTYSIPGSYNATLIATDDSGAVVNSTPVVVTVSLNTPPVLSPFSATPTSGISPLLVTFYGGCSDPENSLQSCLIDFGDGTSGTFTNGMSHLYVCTVSTCTYQATLTATDSLGLTASGVVSISVALNQLPAASLTADIAAGDSPLDVVFTGSCSDPEGALRSCLLDFRDGSSPVSASGTVSHTFSTPGAFDSILIATDSSGASASSMITITVNVGPGDTTIDNGDGNEQPPGLACGAMITNNTVLIRDMNCSDWYDTAVSFANDSVEFNCDGHTIIYAGAVGVKVSRNKVTIKNCNIIESAMRNSIALQIMASSNDLILNNNMTTSGPGVKMMSNENYNSLVTSNSNTLSGNKITVSSPVPSTSHGIYVIDGSGNIITGNYIDINAPDAYGYYSRAVYSFASGGNSLNGNNITTRGDRSFGIYLDNKAGHFLDGNTVTTTGTGSHGIRLEYKESVYHPFQDTPRLVSIRGRYYYTEESTINNNRITTFGPQSNGIYVYSNPSNHFRGNTIQVWGPGSKGVSIEGVSYFDDFSDTIIESMMDGPAISVTSYENMGQGFENTTIKANSTYVEMIGGVGYWNHPLMKNLPIQFSDTTFSADSGSVRFIGYFNPPKVASVDIDWTNLIIESRTVSVSNDSVVYSKPANKNTPLPPKLKDDVAKKRLPVRIESEDMITTIMVNFTALPFLSTFSPAEMTFNDVPDYIKADPVPVSSPAEDGFFTDCEASGCTAVQFVNGKLVYIVGNASMHSIAKKGLLLNMPPIVNISASPLTGIAPLTVVFRGNCTDPEDRPQLVCMINFSDGTIERFTDGMTHTFTSSGTYNVTLGATDSGGVYSVTKPITVVVAQCTLLTAEEKSTLQRNCALQEKRIVEALDVDGCPVLSCGSLGLVSPINVVPELSVNGTMGRINISFATSSGIPTDGIIRILFPVGFNASASKLFGCNGIDGAFMFEASANTILLKRSGGRQTDVTAGKMVECEFMRVINPAKIGMTGAFNITTYAKDGSYLDRGASSGVQIWESGKLNVVADHSSLIPGEIVNVTINFSLVNILPAEGFIKIIFPSQIDNSKVTSVTCPTLTGTTSWSMSGKTIKVWKEESPTVKVKSEPRGKRESCFIEGVLNPSSMMTSGPYVVQTTDEPDPIIDFGSTGDILFGFPCPSTCPLDATTIQPICNINIICAAYCAINSCTPPWFCTSMPSACPVKTDEECLAETVDPCKPPMGCEVAQGCPWPPSCLVSQCPPASGCLRTPDCKEEPVNNTITIIFEPPSETCTLQSQCTPKLCLNGVCTGCTDNAQCASNLCDKISGNCLTCSNDADCAGSTLNCENGVCVGCSNFFDCPLTGQCNPDTHRCEECFGDSDCNNLYPCIEATNPLGFNICQPCTNDNQCERGVCNPGTGQCEICSSNRDCTNGQICELTTGRCTCISLGLACSSNMGCCQGVCKSGVCAYCSDNQDCNTIAGERCNFDSGLCETPTTLLCYLPTSSCPAGTECNDLTGNCDAVTGCAAKSDCCQ